MTVSEFRRTNIIDLSVTDVKTNNMQLKETWKREADFFYVLTEQ